MNSRIINLVTARHQQVQELLPWYVMDTLEADQRKMIDEHLAECDLCRRELDWQHQLRAAHDEPLPDGDVENALARLHASVPALQQISPNTSTGVSRRPWLYLALAAQLIVICGLGAMLLLDRAQPAGYHALGRPGAAQATARLVVMFDPQASEARIREALQQSHTRIIDGPTVNGAYVVAVAPKDVEQAIVTLRSKDSVKLVQRLDAGTIR